MAPEFIADPQGPEYLAKVKATLDAVNEEDQRGVEAVFRGMQADLAKGGHLSHLERPNYEFGRYLARRLGVGSSTRATPEERESDRSDSMGSIHPAAVQQGHVRPRAQQSSKTRRLTNRVA
jgi:hypothetical protein